MELRVPSDQQAPARVRSELAGLAGDLPPEQLHALRLVLSELVTNAVRHGPGTPIRVVLERDPDGSVRGEVVDDGHVGELPRMVQPRGDGGGYGLHIVDGLAREWGVYEGSTHVWFVLDAG